MWRSSNEGTKFWQPSEELCLWFCKENFTKATAVYSKSFFIICLRCIVSNEVCTCEFEMCCWCECFNGRFKPRSQFLPVFSSSMMLLWSCANHNIAPYQVAMALYSSTQITTMVWGHNRPERFNWLDHSRFFEVLNFSMDNLSHKEGVWADQWEYHEKYGIDTRNSAIASQFCMLSIVWWHVELPLLCVV